MPRVHLYTIAWNEAAVLGYFFRHYDPWVERYVVYDDGSTDATLALLAAHPRVEIRRFDRTVAESFVLSAQVQHNVCWKESRGRADWVVVTAIDEHLEHPDMPGYLRRCMAEGVTLVPALGYQMVAEGFPAADAVLARSLRRGAPFGQMSKLSLFRPDAIEESGFPVGRHSATPRGVLRYPERDEVLLLHYKFIGRDYVRRRQDMLSTGLGAVDRAHNWGHQYFLDVDHEYEGYLAASIDTGAAGFDHHAQHPDERWWRPDASAAGGCVRLARAARDYAQAIGGSERGWADQVLAELDAAMQSRFGTTLSGWLDAPAAEAPAALGTWLLLLGRHRLMAGRKRSAVRSVFEAAARLTDGANRWAAAEEAALCSAIESGNTAALRALWSERPAEEVARRRRQAFVEFVNAQAYAAADDVADVVTEALAEAEAPDSLPEDQSLAVLFCAGLAAAYAPKATAAMQARSLLRGVRLLRGLRDAALRRQAAGGAPLGLFWTAVELETKLLAWLGQRDLRDRLLASLRLLALPDKPDWVSEGV